MLKHLRTKLRIIKNALLGRPIIYRVHFVGRVEIIEAKNLIYAENIKTLSKEIEG